MICGHASTYFVKMQLPQAVCFAFVARIIPLSLRKTKLCQQRLPQFGVSAPSCKGSKIRQCLARAAFVLRTSSVPACPNLHSEYVSQTVCSAGLEAAITADFISCDVCPAKCERCDNISCAITGSCRLCVRGNRRTHRAKAEETARHRRTIEAI